MTDVTSPVDLARERAETMYAADVASRGLGIEISDVSPGHARAQMKVTSTMVNGHGIAHGGYVFLLADTAFAFACNTYGTPTVARGCEIVFLRPVRDGEVLAADAAERVRSGRTGIYDVSVYAADGECVAELRGHSAEIREAPNR
jgi:acyl-CoA thioesterase